MRLLARDSFGVQIGVAPGWDHRRANRPEPVADHIDACGHLLILSLGNAIVALDASGRTKAPRGRLAAAVRPSAETLRQQLSHSVAEFPGWLGRAAGGGAADTPSARPSFSATGDLRQATRGCGNRSGSGEGSGAAKTSSRARFSATTGSC